MLKYEEAWNYNEYLRSSLIEYRKKQEKIFSKISLKKENIKKIKNIKTKVNIVVFAEIYCPDSRAVIPFLEKTRQENENIDLYIFPREGNEHYLSKITNETKIPSIFIEDIEQEELCLIYEEILPDLKFKIKEHILRDEKDIAQEIIYNYRIGKYNDQLEEYLVNKIIENII
ncbi:thioredoxin-like protein [Hypnocyclicus thermotrophus]|uniref:Thioredoxin-like protein n=1 Tax=Hypnocyclicus thermotrophus TaxID=1627895 RepID=A0AA46DZH0_9FUSO|nr:thioredoxin family protein [Hypnocyclicus thermotrophus]TDT71827.1 thioredoxin-like protein [Hypnocyclicus thermotrophus]